MEESSMKRTINKLMGILLVLQILMVTGLNPMSVKAAETTRKGYTITSGNTVVYSDSKLTKRIGLIYGSDEVTFITVTATYSKVRYNKDSGGTKTGYIRTSSIMLSTKGTSYTSRGKITTYKRPGGASYGYVAKGDSVGVRGTSGNYVQIKYPVTNGYKYAWIKKSDAEKYIYPVSTSSTTNNLAVTNVIKIPTTSVTNVSYSPYTGVDYTNKGLSAARVAALDKAKQMVTIKWTAPCDFPTWSSSSGSYNRVKATDGTSNTKFVKGKTYIGIPYSMISHVYDNNNWASLLAQGITTSSMTGRYNSYPLTGTAKGIDCSYFIYQAIGSAVNFRNISYQTTSTMLNSSYYKKISLSQMKPGDLFLKKGHVMMYVGKVQNKYAVFEADAGDSKCSYNLYSSSYISSYGCYKYKGFSD
jgi:cell wall-associated NlpC family hydrolase